MNARTLEPGKFIGETTSQRVADAILSEVVHENARALPAHSHQWPYVSMLLQGHYEETVGATTIAFRPFSAVFHGAELTHEDVIGEDGARFFLIELGDTWRESIERLGGTPRHAHELHGEGASWPALRLYHRFAQGSVDESAAEEALFELCGYLPHSPQPDATEPHWLRVVHEALLRDFREPYSLRALAAHIHVDPSHLARTFYRFRGRTIGEFVNRLRAQEACRQLAHFDSSLEAIARSCGFSDQSHMTRSIRELSGTTPAALRRSLHPQT